MTETTRRFGSPRRDVATAAADLLLEDYGGPALVADRLGEPIAANAAARVLSAALAGQHVPELSACIARVASARRPHVERVEIGGPNGRAYEVALLPQGGDGDAEVSVLLVARDVTADRNLTKALIASRQLFKDLVNCSADFAWETGSDGRFGFVSPRGALGFEARELTGRPARTLLDPDHPVVGLVPFDADVPVDDVELWLRRRDGRPACLLVSSVPVYDEAGRWLGARGICRDVTMARERDVALERARERERLQSKLVDTIRNEVDPRQTLTVAAAAIAQSIGAVHCWIYQRGAAGRLHLAAEFGGLDGIPLESDVEAVMPAAARRSDSAPVEIAVDGVPVLVIPCVWHGAVNGAVCVSRQFAAFDADERSLLATIASHIGIAIEQVVILQKLEEISRTDELTGLLNRRAFFDEVRRRHQHLRRMQRHGALLYVDLDNFKAVNDVHGHTRGDEALKCLADLLATGCRAGDLTARLGGDEFALWLEEADEAAATAKARALLSASRVLRPFSGTPDRPLGISIGIAVTALDRDEAVTHLVARADEAMYRAKHGGKGNYAVTHPGEATLHARSDPDL